MRIFKCPKCGCEIPMMHVRNGYTAQCCSRAYFQPSLKVFVPGIREDEEDDSDEVM